jgi:hypothetical protein
LKSFEFRVFLALIHKQRDLFSIQLNFSFNNGLSSHPPTRLAAAPSNNYERFAGLFSLSVARLGSFCVNF